MNGSQRMYFKIDKKMLYITPHPSCELCENEERRVEGRLYSLQIISPAPLLLLFGILADELNDICFTKHQVMELVEKESGWFDWGMKTHLFMVKGGKVISVRSGEDNRAFRLEEHNLFCVGEVWSGNMGHRIYVPNYIIVE